MNKRIKKKKKSALYNWERKLIRLYQHNLLTWEEIDKNYTTFLKWAGKRPGFCKAQHVIKAYLCLEDRYYKHRTGYPKVKLPTVRSYIIL